MSERYKKHYRGEEKVRIEDLRETVEALKKELDRIVKLAEDGKEYGFVFGVHTPGSYVDGDMDTTVSMGGDGECVTVSLLNIITADPIILGATINGLLSDALTPPAPKEQLN